MPIITTLNTILVAVIVTMATTGVGQAGIISVTNGVVTEASITPTSGTPITIYTGASQSWTAGGYAGTTTDPGSWWGNDTLAKQLAAALAADINSETINIPDATDVAYLFAWETNDEARGGPSIKVARVFHQDGSWQTDSIGEYNVLRTQDQTDSGITLYYVTQSTTTVPEPSTAIALGLLGIVSFAGNRRRRRQSSVA